MAAMTMKQVQAAGRQGTGNARKIEATLIVAGQPMTVTVLGELRRDGQAGAFVARADGFLAHTPVAPARLDISADDAAHLDYIAALYAASQVRPVFAGGGTSMDHRNSWGAGSR